MSAPTNHWKLGLFVVVSVLAGLGTLVYLGAHALHKDTVSYTSYFDEAVSGLNLGSPVTFRGVTLGNVSAINVAPDRRHVEVTYELGIAELTRMGLATSNGESTTLKVPPDLRAQLASQGITGTKYLALDFFPPEAHPPPRLPFPAPPRYIPATSSTMKNVADAVMLAADAIPTMARDMAVILSQVNDLLGEVRDQQLPQRTGHTMDVAHQVLASLDQKLRQLDVEGLSNEARTAISKLNTLLARADGMLVQLESQQGLMVSLTRAANTVGDAAENARGVGPELTNTLSAVGEAAQALRELVSTLEQDSDMLLKGRAEVRE
jgi:ABC-type transporter Mla subunit MlaD